MKLRTRIFTGLIFTTLLLTVSPLEQNVFTGFTSLLVEGYGNVGHHLFRQYIYSLPDIQKTIVKKALILFSYSLQFVIMKSTLFIVSSHFAEDFVSDLILKHSNMSCRILTVTEYIGEYLVVNSLSMLGVTISIRKLFYGRYYSWNHDKISFIVFMLIFVVAVLHFIYQLSFCGDLCDRMMVNSLSNMAIRIRPYPNAVGCYFPLVESCGL